MIAEKGVSSGKGGDKFIEPQLTILYVDISLSQSIRAILEGRARC